MLDDNYKWLRRLRERCFFLPDMKRMSSLSFIQLMSLHRLMEWTEEQYEVSLGQISHHMEVPVDHERNVIGLLLRSLGAEYLVGETPC